jgi:adenine-specific DNA-methyltransferase
MNQLSFFPDLIHPLHPKHYPSTRYQGSKSKIVDWVMAHVPVNALETCLDAFGGTGVVAYALKKRGICVTYNDNLRFNALIGKALIENNFVTLSSETLAKIMNAPRITNGVIAKHFHDIYFTDEENIWLDSIIPAIYAVENPYEQAIAFFALFQACIVKRPYNLFHRKNLYIRTAEVERSFGNKASWDRPFAEWFREFVQEANEAIFDNHQANIALNADVFSLQSAYDMVYFDPPYIAKSGVGVDYHDFYHFLEGIAHYDTWQTMIDFRSKHRRLLPQKSVWTDKQNITGAFQQLFEQFETSDWIVSYRSDGIPTIDGLAGIMRRFKPIVQIEVMPHYHYALSKNKHSSEVLLIGKSK